MKVTDVRVFAVDCFRTNWMFVKVYTDEGVTGVGEATLEYAFCITVQFPGKALQHLPAARFPAPPAPPQSVCVRRRTG